MNKKVYSPWLQISVFLGILITAGSIVTVQSGGLVESPTSTDQRKASNQRTISPNIPRERAISATIPAAGSSVTASPTAIGDPRSDLVFTPIEPCRVMDSRLDVLGPIESGWVRYVYVAGISGFEDQGGLAGGCNIPFGDAAAVFINFVAVSPVGQGHLRAFAYENPDPPLPNAAVLNYGVVTGLDAIANGVIVPICDTLLQTCDFDLTIYAHTTTDVVADIYGYFAPPTSP